ncbi:MAG TPA: riboflavin biosynthesis protein RibF [Candidatus Limnocylindria bacterium]
MIADLPPVGPAALCMGVFDGVHRGHRAMLDATVQAAREIGGGSVALVFDPPPDEVIRPGTKVLRLAPLHVTLRRVQEAGIDATVTILFDDALRALSAEEFLAGLAPAVELRRLVMSPESAFGRDRGGTPQRMREHGQATGFEVLEVQPVVDGGAVISSTRLRVAVAAGDLATVKTLGHPAYLEGTVVDGDHRGRELGYPTANLRFEYTPAMPPRGIYTGHVAVPQRGVGPSHPALVSIGVRPTFHDEGQLLVEVHLLDFDGDLYGATLALELQDRLRDEQRFADVPALVEQMHVDEAQARDRLGIG